MKNIEIVRNKQRLDYLFDLISQLTTNLELQAQWARYLCILVAGFIETSIRTIYLQYTKDKAAPNVANYVSSRLGQLRNPNMERILILAGSFDPKWREWIEKDAGDELKASVDSIMALRHPIAHGVTYTRVRDYYTNIVKLIEIIENRCQ